MSKNRDPLALSDNWHVDCALVQELPDDRVVSSRFLFNLPFGAVTLVLLVFFGLKFSTYLSLRNLINDWDRRLAESRVQVGGIKQMQREYSVVSSKIEMAHTLVKNRLFITNFMTELAHTRPSAMVINSVDSTVSGVVVRGTLGESSERSTQLIGQYVNQLNLNPEFRQHFEISLTSFERDRSSDQQNFELTFKYLPTRAP